jgi:hypothetical protein
MISQTRRAHQGWRWRTTAFGGFGLDPPAPPRSLLEVSSMLRHA